MKAIQCEVCGSNEMTKKDGVFQCDYCGTKYTLEEVRKLLISGSVSITGDVKTKDADFIIKAGVLEKYNGESPVVTIPDSVKEIGENAFKGLKIEQVVFSNSVTKIGAFAFDDCTNLTSITIPNSVTSIGEHAFSRCTNLTSITIPNSVTSIGNGAFYACESITSIAIPSSVTSIGSIGCFQSCTSLTSITIPNSVTSIGDAAFSGCTSLTSITIPDSVTSIGNTAFSGCTGLTSITIPDSVTRVYEGAFYSCYALDPQQVKSPIFPNRVWVGFASKGYCERCAAPMKKTLFGSKCTRCGWSF